MEYPLILAGGPSGAGKSSIFKSLMEGREVISSTTRGEREGEIDGVDYYFKKHEEMERLIKEDAMFEYEEYHHNYYGITKEEFERKVGTGPSYAVVEAKGMQKIKKLYPNSISIFIYTDEESVRKQMMERGDDEVTIQERMELYQKDMESKGLYDYVVCNRHGKFEQTQEIIRAIIQAELA